jgi:hypothetical protein
MSLAKHTETVTWFLTPRLPFEGEECCIKGILRPHSGWKKVPYAVDAPLAAVLKWENVRGVDDIFLLESGNVALFHSLYEGFMMRILNTDGKEVFSVKTEILNDEDINACFSRAYNRLSMQGEWWAK